MNSMQNLFNLIRVYASKEYKDTVPALKDKSPIGDVMTPILSDLAIYKEFTVLLGAWIRDEVYKDVWSHPIIQDIVKNGNGRPVGNYTREIANNPVHPTDYDPAHPERVLEQKFTNDLVNFYVRNVYDKFKLTFLFDEIEEAFSTYEGAEEYVSMKKASVETGANFATFNHLKECIFATRWNGGVNVITLPAKVNSMTADNWLTVGEELEAFSKKFTYLNTEYLAYNNLSEKVEDYYGFAKKENVRIIATVDFITKYGYKALANMFNLTIGELKDRVHEIDSFGFPIYNRKSGQIIGYQDSDVACMLVDIKSLKASVDKEQNAELFNPETLSTTIFKHKWQTFAMSPFGKCLMFVEPSASNEYKLYQKGYVARANDSVDICFDRSTATGNFAKRVYVDIFNADSDMSALATAPNTRFFANGDDITDTINDILSTIEDSTTTDYTDGEVITDVNKALAVIFYTLLTTRLAYTNGTSTGTLGYNGGTATGSTAKDVPVVIKRADDVNVCTLPSFTWTVDAGEETQDTITVTIDSATLETLLEVYPRMYASVHAVVTRTDNISTLIEGSPVTINVSPLPSAQW